MDKNPFAINFGKVPSQYISRDIIIGEITQDMLADEIQNQCFMLTGTCGAGKTVTMTAICILREQTDIFADSNGHGALSPDKCEAVPSLTA